MPFDVVMRKMGSVPVFLLLAVFVASVQAQEYPSKPIRLIVATAPGGLMDVAARLMADYFERGFGQRVLVENRGGAGGMLAGDAVAKSAPDGYTLGQIQVGNVAINPFLIKDMPFDPLADLVAVAPLTSSPVVIAISARLPVKDLHEFIALARREPGRLHYGSAGVGTIPHLAGELFAQTAGVQLTPVHYRGAGPAFNDLLAGQVQAIFVGLGVVRTHMAAGTVRVLAVSQAQRLQAAPQIPTAAEAGLPAFELTTWFGIVAPRGTSPQIVSILVRQIHAMQDDPQVLARFAEGGLEPLKESPEQFRARMLRDHERFRALVKAAGLKPE
jgi:tripartite-type tricarboxylate transporter receptor subunit TctC